MGMLCIGTLTWLVTNNGSSLGKMITCFLLGYCCFSAYPATLGLSIELTFPMSPVLVNSVMNMLVQLANLLWSMSYVFILKTDGDEFESKEEWIE